MITNPSNHPNPTTLQVLWDSHSLSLQDGILVGLGSDGINCRPTTLVGVGIDQLLWCSDLQTKQQCDTLQFSGSSGGFIYNGASLTDEALNRLLERMFSRISTQRMCWLRLRRKSDKSTIGRNLYIDKITINLSRQLGCQVEMELVKLGFSQEKVNGIIFGRLGELRRFSNFCIRHPNSLKWAALLTATTDLENVDFTEILEPIISQKYRDKIQSGKVDIFGYKLPIDVAYDVYCELKYASTPKRLFESISNQLFGIYDTNGEHRFYWKEMNATYLQFIDEINREFEGINRTINSEKIHQIAAEIQRIPFHQAEVATDSANQVIITRTQGLSRVLSGLAAFIQWYPEIFKNSHHLHVELSNQITHLQSVIATLANLNHDPLNDPLRIENERSSALDIIGSIAERIKGCQSQGVLSDALEQLTRMEKSFTTIMA